MRALLVGAVILVIGAVILGCMAPAVADVILVQDGKPLAALVVQPDASEQLRGAAGEMQALIQRSTGAAIQTVDAVPEGLAAIHIGRTEFVESLNIDLGDLDGDGFIIDFPRPDAMVILGPTDWGTEFGIYEFLERYVGVRWLMPGPDGTYAPQTATLTVPSDPVREEPAFFSRKYFGLRLPAQETWARRNRLHSRIEFHHQLYLLFPPSDRQEHPEFFPIRKGERYFPPDGQHYHGWQPCFTAPGIVDVAVERIVRFFDEHPEADGLQRRPGGRRRLTQVAHPRVLGRQQPDREADRQPQEGQHEKPHDPAHEADDHRTVGDGAFLEPASGDQVLGTHAGHDEQRADAEHEPAEG